MKKDGRSVHISRLQVREAGAGLESKLAVDSQQKRGPPHQPTEPYVYTETLPRFSHGHHLDGFSTTSQSQGYVLGGIWGSGEEYTFQGRRW